MLCCAAVNDGSSVRRRTSALATGARSNSAKAPVRDRMTKGIAERSQAKRIIGRSRPGYGFQMIQSNKNFLKLRVSTAQSRNFVAEFLAAIVYSKTFSESN